MTNYEFEARQLIGTWLAKEKIKPIGTLRHVYPRCYVVGKAAKSGLIVARPWKDSEEHMKVHTKKYPLSVIHTFDTDLDAGDWCATAYVCHAGVQETVAVGWKQLQWGGRNDHRSRTCIPVTSLGHSRLGHRKVVDGWGSEAH